MSENPFSAKPTIVDEVEEDEQDDTEQPDVTNPTGVQEDYDRVPATGNEVEDEDTGEADEEWAQTPTELFATLDQEKFWWVFVTLDNRLISPEERKEIPVVKERFDDYDDLVQAREETDETIPEGIHVQLRESDKIRYVKGQDEQDLLEWRDLA